MELRIAPVYSGLLRFAPDRDEAFRSKPELFWRATLVCSDLLRMKGKLNEDEKDRGETQERVEQPRPRGWLILNNLERAGAGLWRQASLEFLNKPSSRTPRTIMIYQDPTHL